MAELIHAWSFRKEMETQLAARGRTSLQESHRGKRRSPASKCSPLSLAIILCSRHKRVSTRVAIKNHTRTKDRNPRPNLLDDLQEARRRSLPQWQVLPKL